MELKTLKQQDKELAAFVSREERRQRDGLELIPSENYVSRAVLEALGSLLTNKYSEGYPGKRYYGGQENTDAIERVAIERAKALFPGADHANVQPLSGAPANVAAYTAWLNPGDTILGMNLGHGGHLTHGAPVTFMAQVYNFVAYGVKDPDTGEIDYAQLRELALQHRPRLILAGFSAYSRELDYAKFSEIAKEVDAVLMADVAHIAGLIAGKQLKNPFDYGFHIITTTTHKTLRGPRGGLILSKGTVSNPMKRPEHAVENLPTLIDRSVFPGLQGGPHMHQVLAKAVAFGEALQPEFEVYAKQVIANAQRLAQNLDRRGFRIVHGGTDNHLILLDIFRSHRISGGQYEEALDKVHLTANKNVVPYDERKPFDPSGLRLGTPAITTRGMMEADMDHVAEWMEQAVLHHDDDAYLAKLAITVCEYCRRFPLPSDAAR